MAKASKEYGRRVVDGVEVFEVGKRQLWDWAHWAAAGAGNAQAWHGVPQTVEVMAESLAKGKYVVMELQFCAPVAFDGEKPCIQDAKVILKPGAMVSTRSLRESVEYADVYRIDGYSCGDGDALVALVEIWHIVDDGDLWQAWEVEAAAAGGDLQAAQQWEATFHDDKYLRQIEDQYTGDYHVYDTTVGDWPGVCIADVTQYDLSHGYKYVYEHWTAGGEVLKQCVEDTEGASITCGWYRDGGWHVVSSDVTSISTWEGLEVLRDDGTAPVWCPLRVCFVCWSAED